MKSVFEFYLGGAWPIKLQSVRIIETSCNYEEIFDVFKTEIKKWKPVHCPCNLCKTYVGCLGFVDSE